MSTIAGLPAHILLNHVLVVLVPLTAILAVLCALWPAALQRLVWLVAALSVVVLIVTPMTTSAGEWLENEIGESPAVNAHEALGKTMLYVAIAQVLASATLVFVHLRRMRQLAMNSAWAVVAATFVIIVSAVSVVQIVRVGDSGARAVWSGVVQ
jgi:hypothetical protein